MSKEMGVKEPVGLQGFIQVEIISKDGIKKTFKYNTITKLGKRMMLSRSVGGFLAQPSQIERGNLFCDSTLGKVDNAVYKNALNNGGIQYEPDNKGITLYLVNSDEILTADSRLLPIYTSTKDIDAAKVVGYGTNSRSPVDSKEGTIDLTKGDYIIDDDVIVNRWKFDYAQANGIFNKVCIGTGALVDRCAGIALYRGLDGNTTQVVANKIGAGWFARPGITGITTDTEILIDDPVSTDGLGKARAVLNLLTGDKTLLEQSDSRYDIKLGKANTPQVVIPNKWWLRGDGATNSVFVRNLETGAETTLANTSYGSARTLFQDSQYIYAMGSSALQAYDKSTLSRVSSADITLAQLQLPSYFTPQYPEHLSISENNGKFTILQVDNVPTGAIASCIVCTDIRDVKTSVVDIIPMARSTANYTVNNEILYFDYAISSDLGATKQGSYAKSPVSPDEDVKYMKKDAMNGNLISFVELSSAITKTENDIMYVSYGYRVI